MHMFLLLYRTYISEQEPTKHQYDWDAATSIGFLERHNLTSDFKINVECNHATLSGIKYTNLPFSVCICKILCPLDNTMGFLLFSTG